MIVTNNGVLPGTLVLSQRGGDFKPVGRNASDTRGIEDHVRVGTKAEGKSGGFALWRNVNEETTLLHSQVDETRQLNELGEFNPNLVTHPSPTQHLGDVLPLSLVDAIVRLPANQWESGGRDVVEIELMVRNIQCSSPGQQVAHHTQCTYKLNTFTRSGPVESHPVSWEESCMTLSLLTAKHQIRGHIPPAPSALSTSLTCLISEERQREGFIYPSSGSQKQLQHSSTATRKDRRYLENEEEVPER
ncbi:hypothetical protein BDY19DRAFT_902515 [Irpex rosettiformis]|uniref:Uncharacterized protein n=1 Tax=Irpex rosettiformis TaxID=378272 RepID=A0ACB8UHL8_9APHY|nr:hypothetical protein BDY19DRAFT_902515 [Irpex rosettiformis]